MIRSLLRRSRNRERGGLAQSEVTWVGVSGVQWGAKERSAWLRGDPDGGGLRVLRTLYRDHCLHSAPFMGDVAAVAEAWFSLVRLQTQVAAAHVVVFVLFWGWWCPQTGWWDCHLPSWPPLHCQGRGHWWDTWMWPYCWAPWGRAETK